MFKDAILQCQTNAFSTTQENAKVLQHPAGNEKADLFVGFK